MTIQASSALICGFTFGFYWGWEFALILLASVPVMMCFGASFFGGMANIGKLEMKAYAQSAGYAEQAINAIKVVHTYGRE